MVITLAALALEIIDQLSIGIIQAAGETTTTMGDKIILLAARLTGINVTAPGVGAIVTIFLGGLMVAAVAIVWFSLLIRKALLLIADRPRAARVRRGRLGCQPRWIGKWAAFVLALIVSKLVLVVVFLMAITQMATPIEIGSDGDHRADHRHRACSPSPRSRRTWCTGVIAFLGFDLYNTMGAEQEAKNAMNRPVPVPTKPTGDGPKKVLDDTEAAVAGDSATPGAAEVAGIRHRPRPAEAEALVPGRVRVAVVLRALGLLRVRLRPW